MKSGPLLTIYNFIDMTGDYRMYLIKLLEQWHKRRKAKATLREKDYWHPIAKEYNTKFDEYTEATKAFSKFNMLSSWSYFGYIVTVVGKTDGVLKWFDFYTGDDYFPRNSSTAPSIEVRYRDQQGEIINLNIRTIISLRFFEPL